VPRADASNKNSGWNFKPFSRDLNVTISKTVDDIAEDTKVTVND